VPNDKSWTDEQLRQQVANLQGRVAELKSLTAGHPVGSREWERAHREGKAAVNELRKLEAELSRR
jgi:hypothetical protein